MTTPPALSKGGKVACPSIPGRIIQNITECERQQLNTYVKNCLQTVWGERRNHCLVPRIRPAKRRKQLLRPKKTMGTDRMDRHGINGIPVTRLPWKPRKRPDRAPSLLRDIPIRITCNVRVSHRGGAAHGTRFKHVRQAIYACGKHGLRGQALCHPGAGRITRPLEENIFFR